MGKGGGSSTPTQQTTYQSALPEWAAPYYQDMMGRAAYQTSQPYQSYGGQRLAYFSPMEQQAMAGFGQLGMSGDPQEMGWASQLAGRAGTTFDPGIGVGAESSYNPGAAPWMNYNFSPGASQYQAGILGPAGYYAAGQRDVGFDPGSLADSDAIAAYSNPYMQQVVDIQKREAMRNADQRHQALGLDAARHGSLGGYRDAILRGETERHLGQQLGDIQQEGSERAFYSAQQAFEQDRQARAQLEGFQQNQFAMNEQMRQRVAELVQSGYSLTEANRQAEEELSQNQFGLNMAGQQFGAGLQLQAYQAAEQAKQAAARMGLDAAQINQAGQIAAAQIMLGQQQNQLGAAGLMGQLGGQRQNMAMDRLSGMLGAGTMERGLMQQGLDIGYQDFLRQQGYPMEMLAQYSNILNGLPTGQNQTATTYGQQPSTGQQLMGTGLAALGMYNQFGGGWGGGGGSGGGSGGGGGYGNFGKGGS